MLLLYRHPKNALRPPTNLTAAMTKHPSGIDLHTGWSMDFPKLNDTDVPVRADMSVSIAVNSPKDVVTRIQGTEGYECLFCEARTFIYLFFVTARYYYPGLLHVQRNSLSVSRRLGGELKIIQRKYENSPFPDRACTGRQTQSLGASEVRCLHFRVQ